MDSTFEKKKIRYFLWGLALSLTAFTIIRIFLQYLEPVTSTMPDVIALEKSAKGYRLSANLLFVCGPLCCALLAARKDERIRVIFPAMQISILTSINLMML
jgi:hypothetical protein